MFINPTAAMPPRIRKKIKMMCYSEAPTVNFPIVPG